MLEGFKIGADDYITKPFSMEELVSRIGAILRRVRGKKTGDYYVPPRQIHVRHTETNAYRRRQISETHNKGIRASLLLCSHANDILERNFALKSIWIDDNYFNARSMDVYITKLRKHLKGDPSVEIINIHGKGYKLIAPDAFG